MLGGLVASLGLLIWGSTFFWGNAMTDACVRSFYMTILTFLEIWSRPIVQNDVCCKYIDIYYFLHL